MTANFKNLTYSDGIYRSKKVSHVNYPQSGNDIFSSIEDNSFWYRHRNNCIVGALNNFNPEGQIYDIGGGNGYVSMAIQNHGFQVTLIEPDIQGIYNAKERGIKNLINSSFSDLEFGESKMENVGLFDVLEHIQDDSSFIGQISLNMRNGGLLFITVPSYQGLYSLEDTHDGHFRRYLMSDLVKMLENNGFNVEYSTCFFTYLIIPMYFLRALPTRFHMGKYKSIETYMAKQDKSKYQAEHQVGSRTFHYFLNIIHKVEMLFIRRNCKMKFGASCLIVARKK
jgi:2-polyprenyl-3-methyl-5-hydroxy-6-metoxy-1,4-benzoquinol methylase